MASGKNYLEYILEQLSGLGEIRWRAMMGEYLLYYQGKLVGGIYDDRLLVKPTPSAKALLPEAPLALPYEGAKEMLLVEETDDRELLAALLNAVAEDLPAPRKRS
ncbi:MAG: TfoX/Sxy family protein [Clostridia bacterium]|nr:TfoX/Sxy family protein [Clostridia bacterium]